MPDHKISVALGVLSITAVVCVVHTSFGTAQTPVRGGELQAGRTLFEKRCSGCHAMDREKEGPRLAGIYGKAAGSVASFQYSEALKGSRITWDADMLDKWLSDPGKLVPGNDMSFRVNNADERRDIIAFLRHGSDK